MVNWYSVSSGCTDLEGIPVVDAIGHIPQSGIDQLMLMVLRAGSDATRRYEYLLDDGSSSDDSVMNSV